MRREAVKTLLDDKWLSGLARRDATDFGTLTGMASVVVVSNSLTNCQQLWGTCSLSLCLHC